MEGVISYRPSMGKEKLKTLVVKKLHYDNINRFIDHAVGMALRDELMGDPVAAKMAAEVAEVIYKYAPLRFVKPTKREAAAIRAEAGRVLAGKTKGFSSADILKRHGAR